jgi:DNA-binding HxlR family transcriptional regulator
MRKLDRLISHRNWLNILADRLTRLEKAGLVSRRDDPSHKQKVIYSLTEASIALVPLHPKGPSL